MTHAAKVSDPHIGRTLGGKYRIEVLIGAGGMGRVYRGVQLSVNRAVAIKLITGASPHPPEWAERFRREAEATARLSHPNSVRLFDFGVTDAQELYMVMELLEGENLALHLLTHGQLPLPKALQITRQVLLALSEAHALGIVHRDIKPDNVFLARVHGGDTIAKVMDFGIAGLDQPLSGHKITITGMVIGTPAYMSPEQAQGFAVDARGDLYSVGVMLFELLTRQLPLTSPNTVTLLVAHVTQPPKRLRDTGVEIPQRAAVQALLDGLLAKDPSRRPTIAQALQAIDAIAAGRGTVTQPPPVAKTAHKPRATLTPLVAEIPVPTVTRLKAQLRARHTPGLFLFASGLAFTGLTVLALRYSPVLKPSTRVTPVAHAAASEAPPQPKPEPKTVTIASIPNGARVLQDGRELGLTPYNYRVDQPSQLSLERRGYEPRSVRVTPDNAPNLTVRLTREKPVQPPAATPEPTPAPTPAPAPDDYAWYVEPVPHPAPTPEPASATETTHSALQTSSPYASDWTALLTPADVMPSQQDPAGRTFRHAVARFIGRLFIQPPAPARLEELLRHPMPYANVRYAWLAYDAGVIDRERFHEAIWMLRERRRQRTEATEARFVRRSLTRAEYVKQHELIGAEFWGD